jgi:hypothetical protein
MNEADWAGSSDPQAMLGALTGKASDRKLRLFAVACCRRIWHLLTDGRFRGVVESAEQFADGLATREAMRTADSVWMTGQGDAWQAVVGTTFTDSDIAPGYGPDTWPVANVKHVARKVLRLSGNRKEETDAQRAALRCLFGNPFRPPSPLPQFVLTWNDGTVRRLAEAVYEERHLPEGTLDGGRLAILADALLDVGCDHEELIQHLRSEGPHVRGCWGIDLILNRA